MNFKLQQTYPSIPQGIASFNTLTYLSSINALVVYGLQKPSGEPQAQQPKKKISFKASKDPAPPSFDKISFFWLESRKWECLQAKGKIPTPRTDFSALQMGKCLIIYGGKVNGKDVNQIYALNTSTMLWKKLFSLEGPQASPNTFLFKISNEIACLVSGSALWTLDLSDVKWELSSNELPGSVWQKISLPVPENAVFGWQISEGVIIIVGRTQVFRLNLKSKVKQSSFSFDCDLFFKQDSRLQTGQLLEDLTTHSSNLFSVASGSQVYLLEYRLEPQESLQLVQVSDGNSDPLSHIETEKVIHCLCGISNQLIYFLDPKGQLLSLQLEIPQQDTTRFVGGDHEESLNRPDGYLKQNCIEQEEELQDSSNYLMHKSGSQVRLKQKEEDPNRQPQNERTRLLKSHDSYLNPPKQQHGGKGSKNQTHPQSDIRIDYEESQSQSSLVLKNKLATILTHEHLKRRLLESKAETLENAIKKSQKFVLLLCRYGEQRSKMAHIERVRNLRQELQVSWSKENYFRKQMEGDQIPLTISNVVEKVIADARDDHEERSF